MNAPRARWLRLLPLTMTLLLHPSGSRACSICRCGDPTFAALGPNVFAADQWRIALDWDRIDKANGVTDEMGQSVGRDAEIENRSSATVSRSYGDRLNLVARIPYSWRRLTSTDLTDGTRTTTSTHGWSDPEMIAHYRLWAAPMSELGRAAWISTSIGLKTGWGRNNLTREGVRLDEHAQPGTGSTDLILGVAGMRLLSHSSTAFGSVQYRNTRTNRFHYRYGRVWLGNAGFERKLTSRLDAILEMNYRHAGEDRVDSTGALDPNTGGGILYLQPRVTTDLGLGIVARFSVIVPVARSLHGDQSERAIVNAGITYVL